MIATTPSSAQHARHQNPLQLASRTAMSTSSRLHPTASSRQSHQDLAKTNKQVKDQDKDITTPSHEAREGTSLVSKAHEVLIGKASIRYIQVHQWHPSSGQIISQSANHPHHEQIASNPTQKTYTRYSVSIAIPNKS